MSDLIDRQAAIDAYGDWYVEEGTEDGFIGTVKQLLEGFPSAQLGANLAEVGTDCISRQAAIKDAESWVAVDEYEKHLQKKVVEWLKELPPAQPEIIRCKDCKCWVPGYITDNDDFIPPKCGEWQQMVGHSSDDYCSLAERREVME